MVAAAPYHVYLVSLLATLATIQEIQGVEYVIVNNAAVTSGGTTFDSDIRKNAKVMMKIATNHIWQIFGQSRESSENRVQVKKIRLYIEYDQQEETSSSSSELKDDIGEIRINAKHIASISTKEVQSDFWDLIYYEMTHILQWKANGKIPEAIKDGIAAYMVLTSGNGKPIGWVKFGDGDRWNQSPNVTARFFQYCDELCSKFVPKLNKKMKDYYEENYFFQLTRKTISEAWTEYKNKYGRRG